MKKLIKFLLASLLGVIISLTTFTSQAGKPVGGGPNSGFVFNYDVGAVTNYHAYNVISQVGCGPQPSGTVILGIWYVKDLGHITGTGTVTCTSMTCPSDITKSVIGFLLLADADDVGGDGSHATFTHPAADIEQFNPKWYGGADFVGMIEPDGSGLTLYFGPRLVPFYWDLSPYLY